MEIGVDPIDHILGQIVECENSRDLYPEGTSMWLYWDVLVVRWNQELAKVGPVRSIGEVLGEV